MLLRNKPYKMKVDLLLEAEKMEVQLSIYNFNDFMF